MRVLTAFVDETGALHESAQTMLGVGLLIVRDVGALTHQLHTVSLNLNARLRERRLKLYRQIKTEWGGHITLNEFPWLQGMTRHHEYKYTELREHNILDYRAVLTQCFGVPGSEFHAIIVEKTQKTAGLYGGTSWGTYVMVAKTLLARRIREPTFVCCDWQTRPKGAPLSLEEELCGLPNVVGCLRMTSETSAFLQVTDLLLGAVSFDWRDAKGYITDSKQARAKQQLGAFIKARLGIPPSAHFLDGGRRYVCKRTPMIFSVWQPTPGALLPAPAARKKGPKGALKAKKSGAYSGISPHQRG